MTDWATIVADHGPRVWRTAYRLLNRHADALDCYQETFLAAHRASGKEAVRDWAAYLTALATRRAIDRIRERERMNVALAALARATPADAPDPADEAAAAESMARVRAGLAQLPDRQADVFWLSCVEGLPHDAIAAQLKTSPGAVRVLLHRARTALAAILEPTPTRANP